MITELEKTEIYNRIVTNDLLFYTCYLFDVPHRKQKLFNLDCHNVAEFEEKVKGYIYSNTHAFFRILISLEKTDERILKIKNEYDYFILMNVTTIQDRQNWLSVTYNNVVPENSRFGGWFGVSGVLDFVNWHKLKLSELTAEADKIDEVVKTEGEAKLSLKQIALKLVYENKSVTKENANNIAKEYLHNSGHKLYQDFNFYYSRSNRTANPDESKKILTNKINLFESVIDLLEDKHKEKAIDELSILKTYLCDY